jgi:hypothetical protein
MVDPARSGQVVRQSICFLAVSGPKAGFASGVLEIADPDDAIEFCYEQGWTDGLPVVPPTPARVSRFLAAGGRPGDEVIVEYVDRSRTLTVEKVAINAVMAGCRPEYFPVVLALVDAMADPGFPLHAANASTGGMALGFVVNGPIRNELNMNCRGNVLGPGNRANSTIGRAVRLTQINAMGSVAGAGNDPNLEPAERPILDRSTMGQPGKYAGYHVPEYEEAFPNLAPLHVMHGLAPEQNAVSLFSVVGHLQISAHAESTAREIIDTICFYLVGSGRLTRAGDCVLVIPPENAEKFVRDGFSKSNIGEAVYQGTRRTVADVKRAGGSVSGGLMDRRGGIVGPGDDSRDVAIATDGSHVHVVVAGGPAGAFIYALLPYGGGFATREIKRPESHPREG